MKPRATVVPIRMDAYEATSRARRVEDWETHSYGPNAALDEATLARARSQDATRNNPWIRRALHLLVSHEIGCGIQPRPLIDNPALRAEMLALWNDWIKVADADGGLGFYGQQVLLSRARRESGEVFVRFRVRRPEDGLPVPLQLQLIEADLLPQRHNASNGNNTIRQGIELTPFGQRAAYWFYKTHPGDRILYAPDHLSRVPAIEVLHHYQPQRPGQLRGEPSPVSSLLRARNLDHFESAELTRKKIKSRFAGVIWKENTDENPFNGSTNATIDALNTQLAAAQTAGNTALVASLQAQIQAETEAKSIVDVADGYMLQLGLHERVELPGADNGDSGLEFIRLQLRSIAAGLGVPYELMTGDYSGTNDRIMRVILNTFYRQLEIDQELLTHQILQPVWQRFLDTAWLTGALKLPGYRKTPQRYQRCEWRAHAWSYVNPLQEAQTAVLKIQHGLTSRSAAVAESGWDVEEIDQQQADDRAREQTLGLEYGAADPTAEPTV